MTSNNPEDLVVEVHNPSDGYVPGNHWAIPYHSNHTHLNRDNLNLLEHVNCTYLSTPGRPPNLLALKQHAQSLAVLISMINPSRAAGEIDNENVVAADPKTAGTDPKTAVTDPKTATRPFTKDEAFDWLNNLLVHYDSVDQDHHRPLNSLVNLIRQNSDIEGVEYHCPLDALPLTYVETNPQAQYRPFENHLTLLMHANECLERLDHEYSALGGILSLIPYDDDARDDAQQGQEALKSAKETLVGQWILNTQQMTSRMHELEIAYGNCLDLLANEALVPAQHNSVHGPDGRSGREIVFPQDRWILANAGEDVFTFIHHALDKKEAAVERIDREHDERGLVGGALYTDQYTRGIVSLDFSTRFYRIKGSGHGPIFVLPAFGDRPSTKYTRDMEARPTVATVPTPGFPDRTSAWDTRNRDKDRVNMEQYVELGTSRQNVVDLTDRLNRQTAEADRQRAINQVWQNSQASGTSVNDQIQTIINTSDANLTRVNDLTLRVNALQAENDAYKNQIAAYYSMLSGNPPPPQPTGGTGGNPPPPPPNPPNPSS